MTIDGGHVKLDETLGEVGCLRPFARRGAHVVLDLENLGQTPVALSIACEGPRVVDIKEIVVAIGPTAADDVASKSQPSPSGSSPAPTTGNSEKIRWTTRVGNRLFLRSTIIDTRQELTRTADKVSQIKRTLEDSLLLVEKKVDYLLAKIDVY